MCPLQTIFDAGLPLLNPAWFSLRRDQVSALLANDLMMADAPPLPPDGLFSDIPLFLPRHLLRDMAAVVTAVERVVELPRYRQAISDRLERECVADRSGPGPAGAFLAFDFHLEQGHPRLIEINTNAGGALLNTYLAAAQTTCCQAVGRMFGSFRTPADMSAAMVAMLLEEWRLQRGSGRPRTLAILDLDPENQPLYAEFALFRLLFARQGIQTFVADPSELTLNEGGLWLGQRQIDMVYNRLCDFYLQATPVLRDAWLSGAAVVTPHPQAYARFADKRNLAWFSDPAFLRALGADESTIGVLARSVPKTEPATRDRADSLWQRRRELFFKPVNGYGSRGTYRGAKLTRRVWQEIIAGDYVAQTFVPPEEISPAGGDQVYKIDYRLYSYRGQVLFPAARLYQGQVTNLRTPGGGFAPIYTETEITAAA